jgi:enterochelin esterase-like enzyme
MRTVHKGTLDIASAFLRRTVRLDCYLPDRVSDPRSIRLLLLNDGQDLDLMGFQGILESIGEEGGLQPLLCVGIHAGRDRLQEYGTAVAADYRGRGAKAFLYTHFIIQELLPFLERYFQIPSFAERAFAGFSLGALSAMDIVWNHPHLFQTLGAFSGSFWWRSRSYENGYSESRDRIMQAQIQNAPSNRGPKANQQRFFFECGTKDEAADRNRNGVIDSIDDTMDLIAELRAQGVPERAINYLG